MTDKSHLDLLMNETTGDLRKRLVEEFTKLVRDPEVASASYPTLLRGLLDEALLGTGNASD